MKKICLTFCMAMIAVLTFAGGIKVSKGKASFIKKEGKVAVVFDWNNAKWNNEKPIQQQWVDDFDFYVENGKTKFIEGFNKKSKKVKIVNDGTSVDYIMSIKLLNFDRIFSMWSMVPGHKYKVWAEITVTDANTNDIICVYNVKEFKGGRDFSALDSYKECMFDFGTELAETK